jgi:CDP-paratose 2-epimerase
VRILVTGGAGFVGSNVSVALATRHPDWQVVALDNLHRRGAELNLPRLEQAAVEFVRGDVREPDELRAVGAIDALVECSAEPSVLAGLDGGLDYLVHTNLVGAYNCLELARRNEAFFLFLSTSRVYPVAALRALALVETETRFELADGSAGIAESFPLAGARTPYGATKLAAELLLAEFAESFGLRAVVDRFGVIAGPWQLGKVDQGVFTHWLLAHRFERPLEYIGFRGTGKQVRDLLHVEDLVDLVEAQLLEPERWAGVTANVGGGRACSLSLVETTELCRELTGNEVPVGAAPEERPGDVPLYISDCGHLFGLTDWRPQRGARTILADTLAWIDANEDAVRAALLRP